MAGEVQLPCDGIARVEMKFVHLRKWINLRPAKSELKKPLRSYTLIIIITIFQMENHSVCLIPKYVKKAKLAAIFMTARFKGLNCTCGGNIF